MRDTVRERLTLCGLGRWEIVDLAHLGLGDRD
jgi:hypothetical protein